MFKRDFLKRGGLRPASTARLLGAVAFCALSTTVSALPSVMGIESVSNRADLVSNGDVLVRVTLPAAWNIGQATLSLNGLALPSPFHAAPDGRGWLALVNGLALGANSLTLSANGEIAKLGVTNHPNGGPIFSGPQIQPWK